MSENVDYAWFAKLCRWAIMHNIMFAERHNSAILVKT